MWKEREVYQRFLSGEDISDDEEEVKEPTSSDEDEEDSVEEEQDEEGQQEQEDEEGQEEQEEEGQGVAGTGFTLPSIPDFDSLPRRGNRKPKVQLSQEVSSSPASLFGRFFNGAMLEIIMKNTNIYALSKDAGQG